MSSFLSGHHPAALELIRTLGLEHVTRLSIYMESGNVATVTATFLLTESRMKGITEVVKKFKLVEIKDENSNE
jgi:hypothetical protein